MDRVKRIWYLSPMRAAKVQASLRIRAVSPEPPLLAHTSSESRGTFRQKARSLASLNGWACAVKTYHDGMLEDTNLLDGAHMISSRANKIVEHFVPWIQKFMTRESRELCFSFRDKTEFENTLKEMVPLWQLGRVFSSGEREVMGWIRAATYQSR